MESIRRKLRGDGFEKMPDHLTADLFAIKKTFRFGFPELATCIASSHEHGLVAIGNCHGMVQLLGKPGIEKNFWHPEAVSVRQLVFVPNKAQLLSLCDNSVLYLWSLEERVPDVLHKLAFGQDSSYNKPACVRVLVDAPWAYVGCEGSDVYVLCLETMELSGYVIHWNKLCGGFRQGRVVDIIENPWDRDKVLIGFSDGLAVVWSLQKEEAKRYIGEMPQQTKKLTAICWGDGGKTFYVGYIDGTIATWNLKTTSKPDSVVKPCIEGLKAGKHLSKVRCSPISGITMIKMSNGEQMLVIAGGDPIDASYQSVSVFTGKGGTGGSVFALDSKLIDHSVILQTNHLEVPQNPKSLIVLCEKGLGAYSLDEKQLCTLHVPHPLDLHSSPITCLHVISNVSDEIISSMMSLQSKQEVEEKATGKPLMLSGGRWSSHSSRKFSSEVVITGHTDGAIRVWNLVGAMFQPCLLINTATHLSKLSPPTLSKQGSLTPRTARLLEEYEVIDAENLEGMPKATSSQEGGQTNRGVKSPKPQGSEPVTPTSTSSAVRAEKVVTPTSTQSASVFNWTGAKEDVRGVAQVWFGFEDGRLVAVTAGSCVLLYGLSSSPRKVVAKMVDVILNDAKELDEDCSSSSSAFEEEPTASSQQPSTDAAQGEIPFAAGFQLDLICTVMHQDTASSAPSPATINSVEYSSKFNLLLIGASRGLAVVDCQLANVLFAVTSDGQLRNMADPHRRRESAPLVAMQTAQRKFTIKRTKTGSAASQEEGKSQKTTQSPGQVRRMATTPNFVMKEETAATPDPEVFIVTNVKMTEMTVDRHSNQLVPVIWAASQEGLVAGIALKEIHKASGARPRRFERLPTGLAYEMRGNVLAMFAVSETGHQLPSPCLHWSHDHDGYGRTMSPSRGGSLTKVEHHPRMDIKPTSYLIVVSDSRIKAYDIHKIRSVAKVQLIEGISDDFIYSATFCWIRETPCCVCIAALSGKVFVVALKNLRLVAEIDSGELLQLCGVSTTSVSEMGRVFTFPNSQELQVIALYKKDGERYAEQLPEISMEGVSSPTQSASPPASNILGAVLGKKQTQLDRGALFSSGRAPAVARTHTGPASYQAKKDANSTDGLTGAVQETYKALQERGKKMTEMEEKTERMKDAASDFERLAQQLAQKHK